MWITKEGYLETQYTIILKSCDHNTFNPVISLISNKYKGLGGASGTIADALTGLGVENMTLRIRKGTDERKQKPIMIIETNKEGKYFIDNLEAGYYSIEMKDERAVGDEERYQDGVINILVLGGYHLDNQNGIVSNGESKRQLRIVLTWNKNTTDLDSHLIRLVNEEIIEHTYYGNKMLYNNENDVELELYEENSDSVKIETTIIYPPINDEYIFYVYNYTHGNNEELMNSGAKVQVYRGDCNTPWKTLDVPQGQGYVWNVFKYTSDTNEVIPLETISMSYDY